MGRLPSSQHLWNGGLFRVLASPFDINQQFPKAPILGRTISGVFLVLIWLCEIHLFL